MNQAPCQAGDPEDWFIGRDGLQYHDEPFERIELDGGGYVTVEEQKRLALIRRRQAKDACHECPVRLACLGIALEQRPSHGTWGGYYEEELRQIFAEQDRRRSRRGSVD